MQGGRRSPDGSLVIGISAERILPLWTVLNDEISSSHSRPMKLLLLLHSFCLTGKMVLVF